MRRNSLNGSVPQRRSKSDPTSMTWDNPGCPCRRMLPLNAARIAELERGDFVKVLACESLDAKHYTRLDDFSNEYDALVLVAFTKTGTGGHDELGAGAAGGHRTKPRASTQRPASAVRYRQ